MNNSQSPFIPKGKADILIVDGRAKDIIKNLKNLNIQVISTIKCENLYDAISYHPDIVLHPLNHNTLIVAPNVYYYYKKILKSTGINVLQGEKRLEKQYPHNIAYNVARISKYAIHNFKYTDEKLKFYLQKEGLTFINVKQGYSKCSTAVINDEAAITSDVSIYKALKKTNVDMLLIQQGFIDLPGLNYGFIGGATGLLSPKEILFTGQYKDHPDKLKINNFLKKHGLAPKFISNKKIIDLGSIIPLKYI